MCVLVNVWYVKSVMLMNITTNTEFSFSFIIYHLLCSTHSHILHVQSNGIIFYFYFILFCCHVSCFFSLSLLVFVSVNWRAFACLIGQKSSSLFYDLRQALVLNHFGFIEPYSWRQSTRNTFFFLFTAVAQRNFFVFFFLQYKIRSSTKKHNKTTRFLMIFAGKFLLCVGQFFYFIMGVKDNRNSFTLNEFGIDVFGIIFLRRRI